MDVFCWLGFYFEHSYLDFTYNNSFLGKYGDPVGVHKNTDLAKKDKLSDHDFHHQFEIHQKSKTLLGYGYYLGEKFLNLYGYHYNKLYSQFSYLNDLYDYQGNNSLSK